MCGMDQICLVPKGNPLPWFTLVFPYRGSFQSLEISTLCRASFYDESLWKAKWLFSPISPQKIYCALSPRAMYDTLIAKSPHVVILPCWYCPFSNISCPRVRARQYSNCQSPILKIFLYRGDYVIANNPTCWFFLSKVILRSPIAQLWRLFRGTFQCWYCSWGWGWGLLHVYLQHVRYPYKASHMSRQYANCIYYPTWRFLPMAPPMSRAISISRQSLRLVILPRVRFIDLAIARWQSLPCCLQRGAHKALKAQKLLRSITWASELHFGHLRQLRKEGDIAYAPFTS